MTERGARGGLSTAVARLPRVFAYAKHVGRTAVEFGPGATVLSLRARRHGAAQKISEFAAFAQFLRRTDLRTVLEVGTLAGGTFWALCRLASGDAVLASIDLPGGAFGGGYDERTALKLKQFARHDQEVVLLQADSHSPETPPRLATALGDRQIDLLFIDGDHSYEGVRQDYEMYSPYVRQGGLIAFHDIVPHTNQFCQVYRFWNEIRSTAVHREFVDPFDPSRHSWGGIGVLIKP